MLPCATTVASRRGVSKIANAGFSIALGDLREKRSELGAPRGPRDKKLDGTIWDARILFTDAAAKGRQKAGK